MKILHETILKHPQQNIEKYTLQNTQGYSVSFLNLGGTITSIMTPDQNGNFENIILAYETAEQYLENPYYLGALIGRVAGRIPNAELGRYKLEANEGEHQLHGGPHGFHQVFWNVQTVEHDDSAEVILTHFSRDGDGGYPGNLEVQVTYRLDCDNTFTIDYEARSDQDTWLNLTNHAYFNLSAGSRNILNHKLTMNSEAIAEFDEDSLPTGKWIPAKETPFELKTGKLLREAAESDHEQMMKVGNGFDHLFLFEQSELNQVTLEDEESGRKMDVQTTDPAAVIYMANKMDTKHPLKSGQAGEPYAAICIETQRIPEALLIPGLPTHKLAAREEYRSRTSFTFGLS